ncbi:transposase [Bacillus cereus F65185]|nr:transposase [Bacillus cereus F65185]
MIGIIYVGKSRFYLKSGNHSFVFISVKNKTEKIGMLFVWVTAYLIFNRKNDQFTTCD